MRQTWIIDSIAEDVARVEVDGDRMLTVPASLLPTGAREGDVLTVERETSKRHATVTITIDEDAAREAREASKEQTRRTTAKSRKRDRGGGVDL